MMLYFPLVFIATLISSFASFFLKKSTRGGSISGIIRSKYLYVGGFLYIVAMLLSIWLLKRIPFYIFVPLGGFTYIWTMLISYVFLKEKIGKWKIIGVLLIIAGVICLVSP